MTSSSSRPELPAPPIAMLLSVMFDVLVRSLHDALPAAGFPDIRPSHSINLFRLIDPEGTRPTELARRANITPQAMAEIARHLQQRGYLERVPDPSDGRGRILRLTDRGREASAIARAVFTELEAEWEAQLGSRRFGELHAMLIELANTRTNDPEQGRSRRTLNALRRG